MSIRFGLQLGSVVLILLSVAGLLLILRWEHHSGHDIHNYANANKQQTAITVSIPGDSLSPALAKPQELLRFWRAFDCGQTVSAIRFTTNREENISPEFNVRESKSTIYGQALNGGGDSIHIDGNFELVCNINKFAPKLGRLAKSISLKNATINNPIRHRLAPLLACEWTEQSLFFFTVWPLESTDPLDATFFGPISGADLRFLIDLAALFGEDSFDSLSVDSARSLLDSANPLRCLLGLFRVNHLRQLTVEDWHRCLNSIHPSYFPECIDYVIGSVCWSNPSFRNSLSRSLLPDSLSLPRQEVLLEVLLDAFDANRVGIRNSLDWLLLKEHCAQRCKQIRAKGGTQKIIGLFEQVIALP